MKPTSRAHPEPSTAPPRPARWRGLARPWRAPLRGPTSVSNPSASSGASAKYAAWGFLAGTSGILAIGIVADLAGEPLLIGSFGASAVLLFGAEESPLAQPRNLVGGHVISALVAVIVVALLGSTPTCVATGVGLSILTMHLTRTTHPPGGATALIGIQGSAGPGFVLVPVLAGALILLFVALALNNVVHHRRYPRQWL